MALSVVLVLAGLLQTYGHRHRINQISTISMELDAIGQHLSSANNASLHTTMTLVNATASTGNSSAALTQAERRSRLKDAVVEQRKRDHGHVASTAAARPSQARPSAATEDTDTLPSGSKQKVPGGMEWVSQQLQAETFNQWKAFAALMLGWLVFFALCLYIEITPAKFEQEMNTNPIVQYPDQGNCVTAMYRMLTESPPEEEINSRTMNL